MANLLYNLDPVQHLIADAIGEPGNRTFFLQARAGARLVTLVLEKNEVASLAASVLQLLHELENMYPHLSATQRSAKTLYPVHPVDPLFRIGQLSIGYDEDRDLIWLVAKALIADDEGNVADPSREDIPGVRMVATRNQMRAMSEHALEVISRGRPICPLCNRAIDRGGHFCARTDGHAAPIVF